MGEVLRKPLYEQLTQAMGALAKHPQTLFVGQSVVYDGQAAHDTFSLVPAERKLEFPVAEDFQLGFCAGLALAGYIPVCFYPRMDFFLLAWNQLLNHVDKAPYIWKQHLHIIIRVGIGSDRPLNPGPQHQGNYHPALMDYLFKGGGECRILHPELAPPMRIYSNALLNPHPWIISEPMELY